MRRRRRRESREGRRRSFARSVRERVRTGSVIDKLRLVLLLVALLLVALVVGLLPVVARGSVEESEREATRGEPREMRRLGTSTFRAFASWWARAPRRSTPRLARPHRRSSARRPRGPPRAPADGRTSRSAPSQATLRGTPETPETPVSEIAWCRRRRCARTAARSGRAPSRPEECRETRHPRRTPVPPGTRSREWLRRVPPNSDTAVNARRRRPGEPRQPASRAWCFLSRKRLFFFSKNVL